MSPHGVIGEVPKTCEIIVISDSLDNDLAAIDFAKQLAAWWYSNVKARSAGGADVAIEPRVRKPRKKKPKEKAKR